MSSRTMLPSVACVILAKGDRSHLIDQFTLPSVLRENFDEVVVVGPNFHIGEGYRYLNVPPITNTTNDGLVKRDVGAVAVRSNVIVYLCDDHQLLDGFVSELRTVMRDGIMPWDIIVPSRWVEHPTQGRIRIPNGEDQGYCGGHAGVFRRRVMQSKPWTAQKHHRNWDLISSHEWRDDGYLLVAYPRLRIEDIEGGTPWL